MTSDARKILGHIERHKHAFDLDRGNLGADLCAIFTDGCLACIAAEEAPDGTHWPELSDKYAEAKSRKYPGRPMGVREFLMARPEQVAGPEPEVTPHEAIATYGLDELARQEAAWFQEGGPGRPERRFWGFTADSLKLSANRLDQAFRQSVG